MPDLLASFSRHHSTPYLTGRLPIVYYTNLYNAIKVLFLAVGVFPGIKLRVALGGVAVIALSS